MTELAQLPEWLIQNGELVTLSGLLLIGALTQKQRIAIRDDRDKGRCQAPFRHRCNGWGINKELNVHHSPPQRWARLVLHQEEGSDFPEQMDHQSHLITVCTHAHDMIHPDNLELRAHYRDKQENPVFKRRDELVSRGIPHWYTGFDDLIQKKIDQLNKRWEDRGGKMPPRNGNGKH